MLLLQPLEAEAGLDLRLFAQRLEDALDVHDVLSRLLQMLLEAITELLILHLADQLRQGFVDKRTLDIEDVAQLMQEKLPESSDLRHAQLLLG